MGKYSDLANIIIYNVGGRENIQSLTHCITRLRFQLNDEKIAKTDVLKNTPGIVAVIQSGGQYQVVIGNHVSEVYAEICDKEQSINTPSSAAKVERNEKKGFVSSMIDMISGIISPMLGLLCAAGIIKGLLALLSFTGVLPEHSGAYQMWYAVGDGFYYFLPIILGYTAAKKFKMNEFTGMALGAVLVYPTMVNITGGEVLGTILSGTAFEMSYYTMFFGIPVIMPASGYTSSVVPIILAVMVGAKLECWAKKYIPSVIKLFMIPFSVLFVMVPLTYMVIGPIASVLCSIISLIFEAVFAIPVVGGLIAGALIGGFWQVLVIFGLHWGLMPLALINFASMGYDMILSPFFCVSFATTFTVLAIMLKSKQRRLKEMAFSSFIPGLFGVTEPAIYGITLPKRKPFILSCIGGAAGGAFTGLMGARSYQLGGLGLFGLPNYIDAHGGSGMYSVIIVCIGVIIASAVSFLLTFITYKDEAEEM